MIVRYLFTDLLKAESRVTVRKLYAVSVMKIYSQLKGREPDFILFSLIGQGCHSIVSLCLLLKRDA